MANCADGSCTAFCGATSCQNCSGTDGCWGGCGDGCSNCLGTDGCFGGCGTQSNRNAGSGGGGGGCSNCQTGCTEKCQGTCNSFCNKECDESAMTASLTKKLNKNNITTIAELILYELGRRPEITESINTSIPFKIKNKITSEDINILVDNLNLIEDINIISQKDKNKALYSFGEELVNKLLQANKEEVPINDGKWE